MALHPSKDRVIFGLDEYHLLNKVEVGNYNQTHYIEKEGMHISFISKNDEEESTEEELEDNFPQKVTNDDLPSLSIPLPTSSGTFDNLGTIAFTHPLPSPGVTLEGLAGLSTPECLNINDCYPFEDSFYLTSCKSFDFKRQTSFRPRRCGHLILYFQ